MKYCTCYFAEMFWAKFRVQNGSLCNIKVCSPVDNLGSQSVYVSQSYHLLEAKPLRLHHHSFVKIFGSWIFSRSRHPNFWGFIFLPSSDTAKHCHDFLEGWLVSSSSWHQNSEIEMHTEESLVAVDFFWPCLLKSWRVAAYFKYSIIWFASTVISGRRPESIASEAQV